MRDMYRPGAKGISFEIFPPKTPEGDAALWETVSRLARFQPAFISCTYGAGGTTRDRTIELCREIRSRFNMVPTSHFTCLGGTVDELRRWLSAARAAGIPNIMALRGDPPAGQAEFRIVPGGLKYANELVTLIRREFPDFGIGVAGYPEVHRDCSDARVDLDNLKRKVDAGADAVFTQLFYDNRHFFDFRDRYHQCGLRVPLIPGIMPILNFAQIKRITDLSRACLPEALASRLEIVKDDKEAQFEIGVDFAIAQCRELLEAGVPGIHFYVLNRAQACERILETIA